MLSKQLNLPESEKFQSRWAARSTTDAATHKKLLKQQNLSGFIKAHCPMQRQSAPKLARLVL